VVLDRLVFPSSSSVDAISKAGDRVFYGSGGVARMFRCDEIWADEFPGSVAS
jgi:hypothetical protein